MQRKFIPIHWWLLSALALLTAGLPLAQAQAQSWNGHSASGFKYALPQVNSPDWSRIIRCDVTASSLPRPERLLSGFKTSLPIMVEIPRRPKFGPEGIDAMFEFSVPDGEIDLVWRQSRLLRLKKEIAGAGGVTPVISTGHPGILDFELLHSRLLRLTGLRVGTTDLTILTHNDQIFTLRVNVVYDLGTLRSQTREVFPDASLRERTVREDLIVSGQARDARQVGNLTTLKQGFLKSMQAAQAGQVR